MSVKVVFDTIEYPLSTVDTTAPLAASYKAFKARDRHSRGFANYTSYIDQIRCLSESQQPFFVITDGSSYGFQKLVTVHAADELSHWSSDGYWINANDQPESVSMGIDWVRRENEKMRIIHRSTSRQRSNSLQHRLPPTPTSPTVRPAASPKVHPTSPKARAAASPRQLPVPLEDDEDIEGMPIPIPMPRKAARSINGSSASSSPAIPIPPRIPRSPYAQPSDMPSSPKDFLLSRSGTTSGLTAALIANGKAGGGTSSGGGVAGPTSLSTSASGSGTTTPKSRVQPPSLGTSPGSIHSALNSYPPPDVARNSAFTTDTDPLAVTSRRVSRQRSESATKRSGLSHYFRRDSSKGSNSSTSSANGGGTSGPASSLQYVSPANYASSIMSAHSTNPNPNPLPYPDSHRRSRSFPTSQRPVMAELAPRRKHEGFATYKSMEDSGESSSEEDMPEHRFKDGRLLVTGNHGTKIPGSFVSGDDSDTHTWLII